MTAESTTNKAGFWEMVKGLAGIAVILGAGLFLTGWSYLYGYYRTFGYSPDDLQLTPNSVLIHAIPVMRGFTFWFALVVACLALSLANYIETKVSIPGILLAPLLVISGLLLSRYSAGIGRSNAHRDSFVTTSTLPFVLLTGMDDAPTFPCAIDDANYRLLGRSGGQIIVLLPIDKLANLPMPNIRVCSFPESRIQSMRIQVGFQEQGTEP